MMAAASRARMPDLDFPLGRRNLPHQPQSRTKTSSDKPSLSSIYSVVCAFGHCFSERSSIPMWFRYLAFRV